MDRGRESNNWEEEERRDLTNLLPSNLPDDWGREKEVTEEKQMSNGKKNSTGKEPLEIFYLKNIHMYLYP